MLSSKLIEPFRHTLFTGKYNLLLGSGISLKSRDRNGEFLRGTERLRLDVCGLTGASTGTSLPRAYGLLTDHQRKTELIDKYSNCQPGDELYPLRQCLWKRIFTFNIDDVVENLYGSNDGAQELIALNFDSVFEPDTDISELQCIHLHGYVRQPNEGFVFSHHEYARILKRNNPWMLLLSEILPSESFVIAGTSLNEVDLAYYLAGRTSSTPRRGRGPSLLVEPSPDAATVADCRRYDLTLVEAEFGEFLAWIEDTFPSRPTIHGLVVPPAKDLFRSAIVPKALLRFFSDFDLVSPQSTAEVSMPRAYMYGAEPTWSDIREHLDVERSANQVVMEQISKCLEDNTPTNQRVIVILEDPATGKSTLLKRVGCDLATLGQVVLHVRTLSKIDIKTAVHCLRQRTSPSVILVDNFADHAEQIRDLLDDIGTEVRIVVLAVERAYRREHIDVVLTDTPRVAIHLGNPTLGELDQLLEKYQRSGLVADEHLTGNRRQAVQVLRGDPIAISVCRILNDFRPLDRIVDSLWKAASENEKEVYVACALAHRCHGTGVRRSIVQTIGGPSCCVDNSVGSGCPLPLACHPADSDFLLPQSAVVAERVLMRVSRRDRRFLVQTFIDLANAIAPRVNRGAVKMRTPEARLAGRLFDADKIVRPLLEVHAEEFYVSVKDAWKWNSRYWEQRALLIGNRDIRTALQFARHAVAIERHPHPLTTLGKVLLMSLNSCPNEAERASVFGDAFEVLSDAISMEARASRVTIQPFSTLLIGTSRFLEKGGALTLEQHDVVRRYANDARWRYGDDLGVTTAIRRLDSFM